MSDSISNQRQHLQRSLIGDPLPRLWCPPLTHYTLTGDLDVQRITAHWRYMNPAVRGFLVPGSTGDGWEMTDAEIDQSLDLALTLAANYDSRVLVGVLRTTIDAMHAVIDRVSAYLKTRSGCDDTLEAMAALKVCGFTVCPPAGASRTQNQIKTALQSILDTGLPVALYQLPQITENEMSSDTVKELAQTYGNFIFFKDSSGEDRVADSGQIMESVFLVRGAEGAYAPSLVELQGAYDGLLLSTANAFPNQLYDIVTSLENGNLFHARQVSDTLTRIINATFQIVATIPVGNAFTNANKALEHWMAWGVAGDEAPEPMLHAGQPLTREILSAVKSILVNENMLPEKGYLKS